MNIQQHLSNPVVLLLIGILLFAVKTDTRSTETRPITVTGSANMEIIPNEIDLNLSYREYWLNKTDKKKVSIEDVEQKILKCLEKADVKTQDVSLQNAPYWWYAWSRWKRNKLTMQKNLVIKVKDLQQINDIVDALKQSGLSRDALVNLRLGKKSHQEIHKYREQVKIKALQAAQHKAGVMLTGIGSRLGKVISVKEQEKINRGYYGQQNMLSNAMMSTPNAGNQQDDKIGLSPINLRYEVEAVFEIE